MKALIRKENEVVLETSALKFINWDTGSPLTNPSWAGGPYILVNDYAPGAEADFAEDPEAPVPVGSTVVIDGVTYTRTA